MDVYFHAAAVENGANLSKGQHIEFELRRLLSRPEAKRVRVIK
jgi:cold shock CspA family protein